MKHIYFFILCTNVILPQIQSFTFFNFNWNKDKHEEHIKQEQILVPHAKVTVENMIGNISITTWKKNKVLIEVIKKGTKESIKLSVIDIKYTKEGLSVKTVPLKINKKRLCSIDYNLTVPETAILSDIHTNKGKISIAKVHTKTVAHTSYGSIDLCKVENSVQATTKYGPITIEIDSLSPKQTISARSQKGSILLKIPKETNASLSATTDKGRVTSDYMITLEPRTLKLSSSSFTQLKKNVRATLGTGGSASIQLHTSCGNVKLIEA